MPYQAPGARHEVASATKQCVHGQVVVEDGFVGSAFKTLQVDRFVRPADAATILVGESFTIQLGGILEAPATGNLATGAVDATGAVSDIYIHDTDNALGLRAQGLTAAALNAGWHKVGKVTEVDASRTPVVLRINANVTDQVKGNN